MDFLIIGSEPQAIGIHFLPHWLAAAYGYYILDLENAEVIEVIVGGCNPFCNPSSFHFVAAR